MSTGAHLLNLFSPLVLTALLGFARIGGAIMLLPGFGESVIPAQIRLCLAFAITLLMLKLLPPAPSGLTLIVLAARIGGELARGIWLGLMARLFALALPSAGQIISYQIGLSSVVLPDATLGGESTLLSSFFGLLAPVLILATPLYVLPLHALVASYRVLPPGTGFAAGGALRIAVSLTARSFALGVELAAPFLLAGLVWQVGLAVISRLVPQVQIFLVALPAQLLGGLALFALLAGSIAVAFVHALGPGFRAVFGF
jgi:flagellar biosynthesis protein FliR